MAKNLGEAKKAKDDEFYTQYGDIQREINAYLEYNPDLFKGKTVLLPCDDPEWSNFTKFFAQNFENFGLKKLISTSYAPESKKYKIPYEPTLFESESPQFDAEKTNVRGKIFVLERDSTSDGRIDINDLEWEYLEGDGDFQSDEVKALRKEADFIITNPPFSLYKKFITWLFEEEKQFLIIGNKNSVTYKEVFPLIMNNKLWAGVTKWSGGLWFYTPGSEELSNVPSTWFTNIEHGRRHEPLSLMTEQDNIRYSKHAEVRNIGYMKYDNYDAIDVPFTDAIPSDYNGEMGVPITFLEKYCPEQFQILGSFNNSNLATKEEEYYVLSRNTPTFVDGKEKIWNGPVVNKKPLYKRIIIKRIQQ